MLPDTLPFAVIAAGTGAGAAIDLRTGRVPNGLTFALAGIGISLPAIGVGQVGVGSALAGCALGLALMLPGYLLGATGGGDVKLFAAAGAFLGPTATLWAFMFTLLAGGTLALAVAAYRGRIWQTLENTSWLLVSVALLVPVRLKPDTTYAAEAVEEPHADNRFAYAPAIAIGVIVAGLL